MSPERECSEATVVSGQACDAVARFRAICDAFYNHGDAKARAVVHAFEVCTVAHAGEADEAVIVRAEPYDGVDAATVEAALHELGISGDHGSALPISVFREFLQAKNKARGDYHRRVEQQQFVQLHALIHNALEEQRAISEISERYVCFCLHGCVVCALPQAFACPDQWLADGGIDARIFRGGRDVLLLDRVASLSPSLAHKPHMYVHVHAFLKAAVSHCICARTHTNTPTGNAASSALLTSAGSSRTTSATSARMRSSAACAAPSWPRSSARYGCLLP